MPHVHHLSVAPVKSLGLVHPETITLDARGAVGNRRFGRAELLWSRISREPGATFAGRPGTASSRPDAQTARPNVSRAGAWIQTGWPATMEGAIRSGRAAARALSASPREAEAA